MTDGTFEGVRLDGEALGDFETGTLETGREDEAETEAEGLVVFVGADEAEKLDFTEPGTEIEEDPVFLVVDETLSGGGGH